MFQFDCIFTDYSTLCHAISLDKIKHKQFYFSSNMIHLFLLILRSIYFIINSLEHISQHLISNLMYLKILSSHMNCKVSDFQGHGSIFKTSRFFKGFCNSHTQSCQNTQLPFPLSYLDDVWVSKAQQEKSE